MANMLHHWINGQKVKAANGNLGQIFNPATGEVASQVPFASTKQVGDAIASAQAALPAWSATPPIQRARVMFRFKALLEENIDELLLWFHPNTEKFSMMRVAQPRAALRWWNLHVAYHTSSKASSPSKLGLMLTHTLSASP